MTEQELKECPFCGGEALLEEAAPAQGSMGGRIRWWGVLCRNTANRGGTCAIEQVPSASKEAAIERWNHRTAPEGVTLTESELDELLEDMELCGCHEMGSYKRLKAAHKSMPEPKRGDT